MDSISGMSLDEAANARHWGRRLLAGHCALVLQTNQETDGAGKHDGASG